MKRSWLKSKRESQRLASLLWRMSMGLMRSHTLRHARHFMKCRRRSWTSCCGTITTHKIKITSEAWLHFSQMIRLTKWCMTWEAPTISSVMRRKDTPCLSQLLSLPRKNISGLGIDLNLTTTWCINCLSNFLSTLLWVLDRIRGSSIHGLRETRCLLSERSTSYQEVQV